MVLGAWAKSRDGMSAAAQRMRRMMKSEERGAKEKSEVVKSER
jgi:hypothetical protein